MFIHQSKSTGQAGNQHTLSRSCEALRLSVYQLWGERTPTGLPVVAAQSKRSVLEGSTSPDECFPPGYASLQKRVGVCLDPGPPTPTSAQIKG